MSYDPYNPRNPVKERMDALVKEQQQKFLLQIAEQTRKSFFSLFGDRPIISLTGRRVREPEMQRIPSFSRGIKVVSTRDIEDREVTTKVVHIGREVIVLDSLPAGLFAIDLNTVREQVMNDIDEKFICREERTNPKLKQIDKVRALKEHPRRVGRR